MKVSLSKEQNNELERNESTFQIRTIDKKTIGQIVDKRTGRVYAQAEGASEQEAVENALVEARGAEKPKTPAEILEENQRLREENQRLKGDGKTSATPGDNGDGQGQSQGEEKEAPADDPVGDMTNPELKQALKTRQLPIPEGDARTKEWRDKAEKALRESLQQS